MVEGSRQRAKPRDHLVGFSVAPALGGEGCGLEFFQVVVMVGDPRVPASDAGCRVSLSCLGNHLLSSPSSWQVTCGHLSVEEMDVWIVLSLTHGRVSLLT